MAAARLALSGRQRRGCRLPLSWPTSTCHLLLLLQLNLLLAQLDRHHHPLLRVLRQFLEFFRQREGGEDLHEDLQVDVRIDCRNIPCNQVVEIPLRLFVLVVIDQIDVIQIRLVNDVLARRRVGRIDRGRLRAASETSALSLRGTAAARSPGESRSDNRRRAAPRAPSAFPNGR